MTHEGNVTMSELEFTPEVTDAGKILSCEASTPSDNTRPLRDEWLLDIYCEYKGCVYIMRTLQGRDGEEDMGWASDGRAGGWGVVCVERLWEGLVGARELWRVLGIWKL
ncbi:hypothetical protein E2C01_091456 [Portunus trituberculatus]|uniref:Ig-like domain-containing protein n=1 Tax=Portunus trituberculatus TaxID=210409 RepID=A0A5B7JJ39_PORTR|nr:hypothetical protein [Portunus trituberculatus]